MRYTPESHLRSRRNFPYIRGSFTKEVLTRVPSWTRRRFTHKRFALFHFFFALWLQVPCERKGVRPRYSSRDTSFFFAYLLTLLLIHFCLLRQPSAGNAQTHGSSDEGARSNRRASRGPAAVALSPSLRTLPRPAHKSPLPCSSPCSAPQRTSHHCHTALPYTQPALPYTQPAPLHPTPGIVSWHRVSSSPNGVQTCFRERDAGCSLFSVCRLG